MVILHLGLTAAVEPREYAAINAVYYDIQEPAQSRDDEQGGEHTVVFEVPGGVVEEEPKARVAGDHFAHDREDDADGEAHPEAGKGPRQGRRQYDAAEDGAGGMTGVEGDLDVHRVHGLDRVSGVDDDRPEPAEGDEDDLHAIVYPEEQDQERD